MNEQNLNPRPPFKSGEEAQKMGRKGGLSRSPKKSLAAHIRSLQKKGLTDTTAQRLHDLLTDPQYSLLELTMKVEGLYNGTSDPKLKAFLLKVMLDLHKTQHGSKDSKNTEINVNVKDYKFIIDNTILNKQKEKVFEIPPLP